jgi:hypothetical protein
VRALAVLTLLPLVGCFEAVDGGVCGTDRDCPGAVCTRVGECADTPYALRVTWTLGGQPADAATCAGVSELELSMIDPSTGTAHTVRPVPCPPGAFFYDKLPQSYTDVQLWSFDLSGQRGGFAAGSSIGSNGVVALDLTR